MEIPDFRQLYENLKEVLGKTFAKAIDDDIMTQGAAIAFYTIFSIAPLFILIIFVSDLFLSEAYIRNQVETQFSNLVGPDISSSLLQYIGNVSYSTSGIFTTIIASLTLIFGATTVITQLKNSLNLIWNVESVEISSIWNFLLNRLLSFGVIILVTILLVISLLAEVIIGVITEFFSQTLPSLNFDLYLIVSELTTIAFAVIFFALIFKILPDVIAPWRDILIGALATTVLFMLGKYLIGLYLTASGISAAYRAAGALIIFVVWVYYNIQTILLGAIFTQVYTEMHGGRIVPYKYVKLRQR
ncbi:MAG TPA: YihY/virulence factor BrkB family protein [Balneolaceae bacterium]|nr:YihY/virulence factor BrkB family protein [Balneolaceae bacterium]